MMSLTAVFFRGTEAGFEEEGEGRSQHVILKRTAGNVGVSFKKSFGNSPGTQENSDN